MAAEKTKKVATFVATPDSIPLSPGLVAPAPFLSTPAAYGPEKVSVPAMIPSDLFAGFPSADTEKEADPFAGFPSAEPASTASPATEASDPFAAFQPATGAHTSDEIKTADVAALVADKDFRPVDWLAVNEKEALADPALLQKVQDVYEQKFKSQKGAIRGFVEAIPKIPGAAKEVGKSLLAAAAEPFAVVGRAAGRASTGDFRGALGEVEAGPQAAIQATTRSSNLAVRAGRGIAEALPFVGPETPADFRKRMLFDVEMKKQEDAAAAGNSDLAKALSIDSAALAEKGIAVSPEAIEKLSIVLDPINFIPLGAAIGAVGKFGKLVVATTVSAEAAEKVAVVLNAAARLPGAGVEKTIAGAGGLTQKLGAAVGKAGASEEVVKHVVSGAGAAAGGAIGGSFGSAFIGREFGRAVAPLVAPTAGKAIRATGKAIEVVAKGTKAAAPVVGNIVTEGAKGAAEAAAITFPLTIGASDEEREALMGNIGLAAGLRGGGTAVAHGARAARDASAAGLYKAVERAVTPDSPSYGTDQSLDAANSRQVALLGDSAKNVLNHFREVLRPTGVEIYAMGGKDFLSNVDQVGGAEKAKGFFTRRSVRLNPDGSQTPINQIFLNGGVDAIGHEMYHAFEAVDPKAAASLKAEIEKAWTPKEQKEWADTYNSALNGGRPEAKWTQRLSPDQLLSEAAAEIFGRVLDASDLTGTSPGVQRKASRFMAGVLEKVGFPLGGPGKTAGPGVSELGIRPTTKQFDAAQGFLRNIAAKVNETGSVIGTRAEALPLTELVSGDISRRPTTPAPASALGLLDRRPVEEPVVRIPQPTPPPVAPVAPPAAPAAPGRNIRTTPDKQADFAAQRAAVTNTEPAAAAAAKLAPETQKVVSDINAAVEGGQTAFEVEHRGVKSESTPDAPAARTPRRTEQEAAYIAESEGALPADVRDQHQKVTSFVRWEVTKDGTPQLLGYSLDKAIANIEHLVRWSNEKGVEIPYSATPDSWREVVKDLKDYYNNQAHGYRGDGEKFVRPKEDIQVSLPPEDAGYTPVKLSPEKTQFLNAAQGTQLAVPLTVREQRGKLPGNIKAQLLAELQGRKPAAPADIRLSDIKKQKFKTQIEGRQFNIAEVNPLRNEMAAAGVPVRELIEVTERLNADDLVSAIPRTDLDVKPGVTDIIRSGFLPARTKPGKELETDGFKFELNPLADGYLLKVLDDRGDRVGFLHAITKKPDAPGRATVAQVEVIPEARGQGISTAMYHELKAILKEEGFSSLSGFIEHPAAERSRTSAFPRTEFKNRSDAGVEATSQFLPSAEDVRVEVERRLEERNRSGFPPTETERLKVRKEVDFDARQGKRLGPGEGAGFFLPSRNDDVVKHVADVLNQTPEEFGDAMKLTPGGLTGEAFKLGQGLESRESLDVLQKAIAEAKERAIAAKNAKNIDKVFSYFNRSQYFREAYEAATGTGGSGEMLRRDLGDAYKPPFPPRNIPPVDIGE